MERGKLENVNQEMKRLRIGVDRKPKRGGDIVGQRICKESHYDG